MGKLTFADDFRIGSEDELIGIIDELGFVPFFENTVRGFSLEEHIARGCWYHDGDNGFWPAWEWKGPVIQKAHCAYGKFIGGKAVYISPEWFPDFANYRRDGYDFDARYDDGLASRADKELYDLLEANVPIMSKQLKALGNYRKGGKKGFDSSMMRLQKQCYVIVSDFRYSVDKFGKEYGWGIAEYSTPEFFLGEDFEKKVYERSPEESYERLKDHFRRILPGIDEAGIRSCLSV